MNIISLFSLWIFGIMVKFSELNSLNDELFQRIVGLPRMCFTTLVKKVKNEIESDKLKNPLKKLQYNLVLLVFYNHSCIYKKI